MTIALQECIEGWLYQIDARNSSLGIFNEKKKSFTISRFKFQDNFLDEEYHWDSGCCSYFGEKIISHATAKPTQAIMKAPEFKDNSEKLAWLNARLAELCTNGKIHATIHPKAHFTIGGAD